ncbi:Transposase_IS4 [Hexamita inflata]|uniref:Transposase IS4 n=1 Tax=Hexamita inflata TaxID=28002 RepID=A0AA86TNY8_9EUKA|nr:Transposase IS4 [Hexamita inflata]
MPMADQFQNSCDQSKLAWELFTKFWTPEIHDHIRTCTNEKLKIRYNKQEAFTAAEFNTWFQILMVMMVSPRSAMTDHWSNNPMFGNQFIKSMMTSDAWFEIYRNLQFDVDQEDPIVDTIPQPTGIFQNESEILKEIQRQRYDNEINDGIRRIKWLTDAIQAAFNKSFAEDIDISEKSDFCMDETLIPYLGWLDFRQYLPDKPHPFGLLVRVLALAKSRFIVKFELYTGKRGEKRSNQLYDLMYRFLTSINTTGIQKKTFYADNYYSSFAVCKMLQEQGWEFRMTIRKNRCKGFCTTNMLIGESKLHENIPDYDFQLFEQQVKKTKTVRMIFSNGSTKESEVKRNYKPTISHPKILHEYNQNYSTIDKLDQLTYYMRFPHRCQKWTTCMFIYCIHICILQAHSLFCLRLQRQISIIDFMLLLIDAIQPHTHTQIRQKEVLGKIDSLLVAHELITLKQVRPEIKDPIGHCYTCGERTRWICACEYYYCKTCHVKHLLIEQEQILSRGK